jgi:Ran GTPase-activating protein (RanGAP) involved in mRNA processing and transport
MSSLKKVRHFVNVLRELKFPIEHVDVSMCTLSEEGQQDVIDFASHCPTLKSLDISRTCFVPREISVLIKGIGECPGNKNKISLKMNSIRFGAAISDVLSAFLDKPDKWKFLSFDSCELNLESLRPLVSVAVKLPCLKKLSLSHNFSPTMHDIGSNIAKLLNSTTLRTLILRSYRNSVLRLEQQAFPVIEALKRNSTLKGLDLSYNAMGSAGVELLSQALSINKTLQWLQCDGTYVTDLHVFA